MNNIYHKIFCTLLATVLSCTFLFSQESKHELSVSISGGKLHLNNDNNIGTSKGRVGGAIGLGYTYFLTEKLGIVSGLEMSIYKSEFKVNEFSNTLYNVIDTSDGELFDFHSSINNYEEIQDVTYLNIPLQLQYEQVAYGSNKFYVLGGFKIGIPVKGKYETTKNSFVNKGFFHETGIWGGEGQDFMGFGSFNDKKSDGDLSLKTSISLSAETGMKWRLGENLSLYTGVFIDYGLNNITSGNNTFISLNETATGLDFSSNSVLNSKYDSENLKKQFVDRTSLLGIGFKVRLAFGL